MVEDEFNVPIALSAFRDKRTDVFFLPRLYDDDELDLCEGGSFSPTIFNSDIELSVFPISVFDICLSVCRFVEGNICLKFCTLSCLVDIKKRSFLSSLVL